MTIQEFIDTIGPLITKWVKGAKKENLIRGGTAAALGLATAGGFMIASRQEPGSRSEHEDYITELARRAMAYGPRALTSVERAHLIGTTADRHVKVLALQKLSGEDQDDLVRWAASSQLNPLIVGDSERLEGLLGRLSPRWPGPFAPHHCCPKDGEPPASQPEED